MAIGKTFIQILGPNEQFPYNPGFPTIFLQKQTDVNRSVFGFSDGQGNTFSSFLVLEKGPGPGNKLSKIFDVNAMNPNDGDSLVFDSATSKWINQAISGGTGSSTFIQNGLNIYTGGTSSAPTINISAATLSSLSATTVSGGTIYSGSTNLETIISNISSEMTYWKTVLGTPVRVGNTSFTITDVANAGLYDQLYSRTTVLKWTDVGITKLAMVASATYTADTVTITIIGDTLTASATMNTIKYSLQKADVVEFKIAGTIGAGNDLTARAFAPCTVHIFGATAYHGSAGATTSTTYTISKNAIDGTGSVLASAVSIASGATVATADVSATSGTELVQNDYLTLNCTTVSSTPPVDAYVQCFVFSSKNSLL